MDKERNIIILSNLLNFRFKIQELKILISEISQLLILGVEWFNAVLLNSKRRC